MGLFFKSKTKAEQSRINALKATKDIILKDINIVSKNGHFSTTKTIRKELMDGCDLSADIVTVLKEEFEKEGYKVTIQDDTYFIINW